MKSQLILLAFALVPLLLAFVFRVNSVMLFLSLACGSLLQKTLGESTSLALWSIVKNGPIDEISNLILLGLPVLMTLVISRKTMRHSGVFLQLVPLIATCAAAAMLALPLLSPGIIGALYAGPFGKELKQSQDVVIALAAVLNLMLAWRVYRYHDHSKHGK